MKKSFNLSKVLTLLLISSLSMTVMNCSKADDVSPPAQIVGTWKITKFLIKEGTKPEEDQFPLVLTYFPCFKDLSYTFKINGDFLTSATGECQLFDIGSAKYEITDGKLIIKDTSGYKTLEEDVSFNGKEMTWVSSEIIDNNTIRYKKTILIKQ